MRARGICDENDQASVPRGSADRTFLRERVRNLSTALASWPVVGRYLFHKPKVRIRASIRTRLKFRVAGHLQRKLDGPGQGSWPFERFQNESLVDLCVGSMAL